jgi:hypothetical protein
VKGKIMSEKDKKDPLWWAERISEGGIALGIGLTAEHKINYGRWYDEDKEICHGKIGIGLAVVSSLARIGCAIVRSARPKCPQCSGELTYVLQEKKNYCNTCKQYV